MATPLVSQKEKKERERQIITGKIQCYKTFTREEGKY